MDVRIISLIVTAILLVLHWKGPNAVWKGATLGIMPGVIVALIVGDWSLLVLIVAIGTVAGTVFATNLLLKL